MRPLVAVLLVALLGCGGGTFFVGVNTNTGNVTFLSGTVSIVQLAAVSGSNGTNVTVTIVTLIGNNTANTLTLCGANTSLFPMNTFVRVNFTPAQPCVSSFVVVN
jgi:hypothetical protein